MKRLVLLGGGHAHLFVLEAFAREQPDARVSLITPDALTPYSGMMPGVIAGHYDYRQACIDLAPLAARAGCALRLDAAVSLDAGQRQIRLASGELVYQGGDNVVTQQVSATQSFSQFEFTLMRRPSETETGATKQDAGPEDEDFDTIWASL